MSGEKTKQKPSSAGGEEPPAQDGGLIELEEPEEEIPPRLATPERPSKFRYVFGINKPKGTQRGHHKLPTVEAVAEHHRKGTGEDV